MLIAVEDLAHGPVRLEHTFPRGEIDARDPGVQAIGPLAVHLQARMAGPELRIHVQVTGAIEVLCARCLTSQPREVAGDWHLIYHPASELAPAQEVEIHEGDTDVGFFVGRGVEVEEMLREQILLALPMRTLCRDECRGLCPQCGKNWNEGPCACPPLAGDERWRKLAEIWSRR